MGFFGIKKIPSPYPTCCNLRGDEVGMSVRRGRETDQALEWKIPVELGVVRIWGAEDAVVQLRLLEWTIPRGSALVLLTFPPFSVTFATHRTVSSVKTFGKRWVTKGIFAEFCHL